MGDSGDFHDRFIWVECYYGRTSFLTSFSGRFNDDQRGFGWPLMPYDSLRRRWHSPAFERGAFERLSIEPDSGLCRNVPRRPCHASRRQLTPRLRSFCGNYFGAIDYTRWSFYHAASH